MFKVFGITEILKIGFFNSSGTEIVKQNENFLKTIQNLLSHFSSNFNKN